MGPLAPDRLHGLSLLVVDDDPDARELLADFLGAEGGTVHLAEGPMAALAQLSTHTPDVLISDIAMPDLDGYWFIQHVRGLGDPSKRSIALTAFTRDIDRVRALTAGFDRHIPKPPESGRPDRRSVFLARARASELAPAVPATAAAHRGGTR